jgi:hypothetical protein
MGYLRIILSPDEGFVTTISGTGFNPRDDITIKWGDIAVAVSPTSF